MAQTPHELKYEDALARLEKLVDELDLGALTKKLEQGKKKVAVLIKTHLGEPSTQPFEDAGDDAQDPAS
jgi:exonuclease VII small subunit